MLGSAVDTFRIYDRVGRLSLTSWNDFDQRGGKPIADLWGKRKLLQIGDFLPRGGGGMVSLVGDLTLVTPSASEALARRRRGKRCRGKLTGVAHRRNRAAPRYVQPGP